MKLRAKKVIKKGEQLTMRYIHFLQPVWRVQKGEIFYNKDTIGAVQILQTQFILPYSQHVNLPTL